MKKQLMIVGIIVLLITVGLCGCNGNSENFEDTNNVKLVSYSVVSYKFGKDVYSSNIVLGEGFNYKEDMVGFKVSGSIVK